MDARLVRFAASRFTPEDLQQVRNLHLPKQIRGQPPEIPAGTDLFVWRFEEFERPRLIVFKRNQSKPILNMVYSSPERRDAQIDSYIRVERSSMLSKMKQQVEKQQARHTYKVGDILYASWGYEQTNVNFYQIVAVAEKSIKIRPISQKVVEADKGTEKVVAVPNTFTGPAITKVPQYAYGSFRVVDDRKTLSLWDGRPTYQTAFGWGH